MSFTAQLKAFTDKAGKRSVVVGRKVAAEIFTRVILRTPVDTGHARANWQAQIGAPARAEVAGVDPNGQATAAAAVGVAADWDPNRDGSVFLSNNLPYIGPLEEGWSQQAPAGMVRLTVLEFADVVDLATSATKRDVP